MKIGIKFTPEFLANLFAEGSFTFHEIIKGIPNNFTLCNYGFDIDKGEFYIIAGINPVEGESIEWINTVIKDFDIPVDYTECE